jgi:hypothetical protein
MCLNERESGWPGCGQGLRIVVMAVGFEERSVMRVIWVLDISIWARVRPVSSAARLVSRVATILPSGHLEWWSSCVTVMRAVRPISYCFPSIFRLVLRPRIPFLGQPPLLVFQGLCIAILDVYLTQGS